MKKDFNQPIIGQNGKPLTDENDKILTAADVIKTALWNYAEQNTSGEEKFKQHKLALHIDEGKDEFEPEDLALIKKVVNGWYRAPLVVGRIFDMVN